LVKYLPPANFATKSLILGKGYLFNLFTVYLKSPHILTEALSAFNTGTMGTAHSENITGSTQYPPYYRGCNLLNSFSIRVLIKNGTDLAWKEQCVASRATCIVPSNPFRVPNPGANTASYLSINLFKADSLIVCRAFQSNLKQFSQFLPNKLDLTCLLLTAEDWYSFLHAAH